MKPSEYSVSRWTEWLRNRSNYYGAFFTCAASSLPLAGMTVNGHRVYSLVILCWHSPLPSHLSIMEFSIATLSKTGHCVPSIICFRLLACLSPIGSLSSTRTWRDSVHSGNVFVNYGEHSRCLSDSIGFCVNWPSILLWPRCYRLLFVRISSLATSVKWFGPYSSFRFVFIKAMPFAIYSMQIL